MSLKPLVDGFRRKPYRNIFIWLMIVVLADSLAPNYGARGRFADLMLAAILSIAMIESVRIRHHGSLALALGLPAIGLRVFSAFSADNMALNTTVLFFNAVFMAFLIWNLLADLRRDDRPTDERIYGALCAYVFIGLLFSLIYTHMQYRDPATFAISDALATEELADESNLYPLFTYFSFVTMTTLGYGDITPVAEHARTLAWFEALLGQLYLAVMVAGFVAVHISENMIKKRDKPPANDVG